MKKDKVRTAIVGLGEFGELHLRVLSAMRDVEVVALISRSESRSAELARVYNVPHRFLSVREMLEKVKVDTIHVATEENRHLEPTCAALRAGVDVFLEKPISHEMSEVRQITEEAVLLKRKLMVGHILRFDPRYSLIKERIQKGDLGYVTTVYGRRNGFRSMIERYNNCNRLLVTAIHDIDIILWYLEGRRPIEVYMKTMQVCGKTDDVFWGMITFNDGSLGIVESNWLLPPTTRGQGDETLEVIGTKGIVLMSKPGGGPAFWLDSRSETPDTSVYPMMRGEVVGALKNEIDYFVHCILDDRPINMPRLEESILSHEIADALIRSSKVGTPIRLQLGENLLSPRKRD